MILAICQVTFLSRISIAEETSGTDVQLLSYSGFPTPEGMYRVAGEVVNNGSKVLGNVTLDVTSYDANNLVISKNQTVLSLATLRPGRKSPFVMYLAGQDQTKVSRCTVSVLAADQVSLKPSMLDLIGVKNSEKSVYGVLYNAGDDSRYPAVYSTFYDVNKTVVEVVDSSDSGLGVTLTGGSSTYFEINFPRLDISNRSLFQKAQWFSVTAETRNYSIIAEVGYIRLVPPPVANFTMDPPSDFYVNETIVFDASASYDLYGYITDYSWDFGDNATDLGNTTTHAYALPGNYTVALTVSDNNSRDGIAWQQIVVTENVESFVDPNMVFYLFGALVGISFVGLLVAIVIARRRSKKFPPRKRHLEKAGNKPRSP